MTGKLISPKYVLYGLIILAFAGALVYGGVRGVTWLYAVTHQPEKHPVSQLNPKDFNKKEASVYVGENWQGKCPNGSWMIRPQASDSESLTLLEGNPNESLTAVAHKAPGGFFSGCKFVRIIRDSAGTWKANIYGR